MTLIGLNVLAFVATISRSGLIEGGAETPRFVDLAQVNGAIAVNHDYYRIFTAMFLHFGLIHIGANMLALFYVGSELETVLGWRRFLATYLTAGIGGGVATYLLSSEDNFSAGASGAIFGVFAVLLVTNRKRGTDNRGIVGTLVLNIFITFAIPGISITDHLGGFASGCVLGLVFTRLPRKPGLQVAGFAGILVVLVVATLARTAALT